MATAPESSEFVSKALREEFSEALTKAALETLAIVIYKGPLSRSEVDYIRGVHSSFSLRNLLVRGLIERVPHPDDSRVFLYRPSMNILTFFGVPRLEDMPEYAEIRKKLDEFLMQSEAGDGRKDVLGGVLPPHSS
jgi:segregation and condensation protein B